MRTPTPTSGRLFLEAEEVAAEEAAAEEAAAEEVAAEEVAEVAWVRLGGGRRHRRWPPSAAAAAASSRFTTPTRTIRDGRRCHWCRAR